MSYTFKQVLLSQSKYSLKSPYTMKPEYITIHNTANDASAANEVSYHNSNNNQVSYHAAIDDKEVIQCIPYNRNAWHCGDGQGNGNKKSIGLEICYSKSGGERYEKAENNAAHYTAKLLKEFNLDISRVKQHYDWSKKDCPHRIRAKKDGWKLFIDKVKKELELLNKPSKPVVVTKNTFAGKELFSTSILKEAGEYLEKEVKKGTISEIWLDRFNSDKLDEVNVLLLLMTILNRK